MYICSKLKVTSILLHPIASQVTNLPKSLRSQKTTLFGVYISMNVHTSISGCVYLLTLCSCIDILNKIRSSHSVCIREAD